MRFNAGRMAGRQRNRHRRFTNEKTPNIVSGGNICAVRSLPASLVSGSVEGSATDRRWRVRYTVGEAVSFVARRAMQKAARTARPGDNQTLWNLGKADERRFWRAWIDQQGMEWSDDFQQRLDPGAPFDDWVEQQAIDASITGPVLGVLDVGAGPVTCLGYRSPNWEIHITATDALGSDYAGLWRDAGRMPPVVTRPVPAEDLSAVSYMGPFDVVHMRNALDHCVSPVAAIEQMTQQVADGGVILLRHEVNEAENESYKGLHQWNLEPRGDNLHVWNKNVDVNLTGWLDERGFDCQTEALDIGGAPWVRNVVTRR